MHLPLPFLRYLHFVNNNTLVPRSQPGHNCSGKVQPVIDHLSQRFLDVYDPHCEVAVNEAIIKFFQCGSCRKIYPNEANKNVLKVWVLGYSHNGYSISKSLRSIQEKSTQEVDLGVTVVKALTYHLRGNFHQIFFDNFFTCLKLIDLEANGL